MVTTSLKRVMGLIALETLEIIASEVLVVVLEYKRSVRRHLSAVLNVWKRLKRVNSLETLMRPWTKSLT